MTSVRLIIMIVSLTLFPVKAIGQSQPSQAPEHSALQKQSKGFFDYALGKINPDGEDYGSDLARARYDVVQSTVDDLFFWSNIFTLVMLACVSCALYLHWRASQKKESIAVTLITQLHNGRLSDRSELDRRTAQYNVLAERYNAEIEQSLSAQSRRQASEESTSTRIKRNAERLGRSNGETTISLEARSTSAPSGSGTPQNTLLLDHRLEAMRNTEANLRERLNQTTLQLEQERQKNARLKGI